MSSHFRLFTTDWRFPIANCRFFQAFTRAANRQSTIGNLVKRLLTWFPLCLAQTARLQRLDNSQRLFGRTSNVQIVNDLVTQDAFRIDHKESAKRNAAALDEHAVLV